MPPPADPPASPDPGAAPPRSLARRAAGYARRRIAAGGAAGAAALARHRAARRAARLDRLRALALADPAAALAATTRARRLRPGDRLLAEAEALLAARVRGWPAAVPLFAGLAALPSRGAGEISAAALLRRGPDPALDLALPVPDRPPAPTAEAAGRMVVYTAAFGGAPPPAPLFQRVEGLRCLLLTDRDLAVPGWQSCRIPAPDPDPARAALFARIRGAELLAAQAPEALASLWLDPALRLPGNLHTLLARWLAPRDFVCWRHAEARDWRELVEARLTGGAALPDPGRLAAFAASCEAAGLPPGGGACDTRALWRRHDRPAVAALMAAWWTRAAAAPETADAAFAALLADPAAPPARPAILPAHLGTPADGILLAEAPWPAPARKAAADPAAASPGRPLPVAFLYAERYAASASTFLRAGQLAELVAEHHPERYDIAWTPEFAAIRDRVVILTKWALQSRGAEEIADLRARNVAVIGVWDDLPADAAKMAALDASMTLSHSQTLDLARRFPATPAFHVTHHVNRRIPPCTPPADRLRAGYFGELANTALPGALGGLVELVGIDTSKVETDWIERLPEFNAHWILRRRRPIDGAKPFLKGFLAARCGAVAVAARGDEDALYYLGDDYPFFVPGLDPGDLEAHVVAMAAGFGGPEWRQARAIMEQVAARSTDAVVAAEFAAMIDAVTA